MGRAASQRALRWLVEMGITPDINLVTPQMFPRPGIADDVRELLEKCLHEESNTRPTAADVAERLTDIHDRIAAEPDSAQEPRDSAQSSDMYADPPQMGEIRSDPNAASLPRQSSWDKDTDSWPDTGASVSF